MALMDFSKLSLHTFKRNIYTLFAYDLRSLLLETRDALLIELMRSFRGDSGSEPYHSELDYVFCHGLEVFPYDQLKRLESVESGFDNKLQMPYVIHKKKRLYFPKDFSVKQAEQKYRHYIENENLLGGNYKTKMPHCYQSEWFKVNEGDVFVDLGAAEGLVALDVIDRVSKVYIIESNKRWLKALRATFEPYKEKCVIIHKLVTDHNGRKSITLEHLLKDETTCPVFVKMDIEGFEKRVLAASNDFLSKRNNIKLACCAYHFEGDAQTMVDLFEQSGYQYEFSNGWMLFSLYDKSLLNPPFFRHGIIRAWK